MFLRLYCCFDVNDLVQLLFDVIVCWKFPSYLRSFSVDDGGDECVLNVSTVSLSALVQLSWQYNLLGSTMLYLNEDRCNKITNDIRFLHLNFLTVLDTYVYTFRYISTSSSETGVLKDSAKSLKALHGTWGPKRRNELDINASVRSINCALKIS